MTGVRLLSGAVRSTTSTDPSVRAAVREASTPFIEAGMGARYAGDGPALALVMGEC
jgi:hypothetical protein